MAKAESALTDGRSPSGIALGGSAAWTSGSDQESGTAVLTALPGGFSRVELDLGGGTRVEVRSRRHGVPSGAWRATGMPAGDGAAHRWSADGKWLPAVWFYPALWLGKPLAPNTQTLPLDRSAPWRVEDLGAATLDQGGTGIAVEHLVYYRWLTHQSGPIQASLAKHSRCDVFLDSTTGLPVTIRYIRAAAGHPYTKLEIEIRFGDYFPESGVTVPRDIERWVNGVRQLAVTVNSVTLDPGLSAASFTLAGGAQ